MTSDTVQNTRSTVVVIDDKDLRRAALVAFLEHWAADNGAELEAASRIEEVVPAMLANARLVIANIGGARLGDAPVRDELSAIREAASDVGLAIVSDSARIEDMVAGFQLGADGYVPTSIEPRIALQALGFIAAGGQFFPPTALVAASAARTAERTESGRSDALTVRQREVLKLLRDGKPNKVIARELDMQEATVKVHVRQIMRKLGVSNRTQAALACASEPSLFLDGDEDAARAETPADPARPRSPAQPLASASSAVPPAGKAVGTVPPAPRVSSAAVSGRP